MSHSPCQAYRGGQLDPQSLAVHSVGVLIESPLFIAGKLPWLLGGTMLPEHFVINIADAECSVASWDATSSQFVLKIEKDIGPESGVLVFSGVSFVNMPPEFIVAFVASSRQQVPDFPGVSPEDDEFLFLFQEAWGRVFYVLAERADYSITA